MKNKKVSFDPLKNYYSIKKYSDNYYRLTFIKNKTGKGRPVYSENNKNNSVKLDNSISRAKSKIFEYALCNEFDYFITLTLDSKKYNRSDLDKYIKDLGQFIRDYRKKYDCDIQYLLIPELHLDKKNWHMHGLIKGLKKDSLELNKNGYLDWKEYSKKFGYCSVSEVKNQVAVSKYITKYISKSFCSEKLLERKYKKLYYCSRGLQQSEMIKEGQMIDELKDVIEFDFENEYVSIKDFDYSVLEDYLHLGN